MTRKAFDDAAGAHVTQPSTLPSVDEIYEPLVNVFAVACPRCDAAPGKPCVTLVGTRGERTYPHPARLELARRSAT